MAPSSMAQQQQYHSHQYRTGQYHSGSSNSISGETGNTRTNSGMSRSLVEMSGGVSGLQQPQQNIPMQSSAQQVRPLLKFLSLSIFSNKIFLGTCKYIMVIIFLFTATQQSQQLAEECYSWSTSRAAAIPTKFRWSQPCSKWTWPSSGILTEQRSVRHDIEGKISGSFLRLSFHASIIAEL